MRIAKKLDGPQRKTLIDLAVSQKDMESVAQVKAPEAKEKAIALIASGMDPKVAIAHATAPDGSVISDEIANRPDPSAKTEAEMTGDEWLDRYCGEVLAKLVHKAHYKADALLWRAIRDARDDFRSRTKKALSQSKVGVKGPFHYLVSRFVNVAHPSTWLPCGPCSGSGNSGDRSQCPSCRGNAFAYRTES